MSQLCVFVLDLDLKRLQVAKELGADLTIHVEKDQSAKEVASRVREMLDRPPNKSIECTGAESSINTALYVSKKTRKLGVLLGT